jgi:hypothetical protein
MLIQNIILPDISITITGFVWTVAAIILLLTEKGRLFLSSYKTVALFFVLLIVTLLKVLTEISIVEQMAHGLKILDTRLNYNPKDVLAFAVSLGEAGRLKYAAFQLGTDTLAPPAFACFVSSVAFTFLPREKAVSCLKLIFIYLFCAVSANALMPIVMLNFSSVSYAPVSVLLNIVPWLDFLKYQFHIYTWLFIILNKIPKGEYNFFSKFIWKHN